MTDTSENGPSPGSFDSPHIAKVYVPDGRAPSRLELPGSIHLEKVRHVKKAADMIDSLHAMLFSIPYISKGDLRITATLDSRTISRGSNCTRS